jgi:hypothetical protein
MGASIFVKIFDFVGGEGVEICRKNVRTFMDAPVVLRYVLVDSGYSTVLGESAKRSRQFASLAGELVELRTILTAQILLAKFRIIGPVSKYLLTSGLN